MSGVQAQLIWAFCFKVSQSCDQDISQEVQMGKLCFQAYMIVSRIQFLGGCWTGCLKMTSGCQLKAGLSPLPCDPLHSAAQSMATCFFKASKEQTMCQQDGHYNLCNVIMWAYTSLLLCQILLVKSKSYLAYTQEVGLTRVWTRGGRNHRDHPIDNWSASLGKQ